jgi:hypothetical protein
MLFVVLVGLVLMLVGLQRCLYQHLNLIVELGNRSHSNEVCFLRHLCSFHYRNLDSEKL